MLNKLLQLFKPKIIVSEVKEVSSDKDEFNPYDSPVKQSKEILKPASKKKTTTLTIYFTQGNWISWDQILNEKDKRFAWSEFYTWYFVKTTPFFVFKHKGGETMFMRKDITRIEYLKPLIRDQAF